MTKHHKKTLNYLKYQCGFSYKQCHSIIARYGASIGKPKPKNTQTSYYNNICDHIQASRVGWDKFMKFYITVKDDYPVRKFKNLPMEVVRKSYKVTVENTDGSFDYGPTREYFKAIIKWNDLKPIESKPILSEALFATSFVSIDDPEDEKVFYYLDDGETELKSLMDPNSEGDFTVLSYERINSIDEF